MVYVALLRGINVGGNTAVNMATLKTCFETLGYQDVKTYINSGNVIFKTKEIDNRKLEVAIEKSILETFGHTLKVVVCSYPEMKQIIDSIPKNWLTTTDKKCNVIFLRHEIDNPELISQLKPKPGIEELTYQPGALLWAAKTSDLTRSSMVKLSQNAVYKQVTVRNLNTARKIYDLMTIA